MRIEKRMQNVGYHCTEARTVYRGKMLPGGGGGGPFQGGPGVSRRLWLFHSRFLVHLPTIWRRADKTSTGKHKAHPTGPLAHHGARSLWSPGGPLVVTYWYPRRS